MYRILFAIILLSWLPGIYSQPDPLKVNSLGLPGWITNKPIQCLYEDADELLWIASNNNLYVYNSHVVNDYSFILDDSGHSQDRISTIFELKGNIYIGTHGGFLHGYHN